MTSEQLQGIAPDISQNPGTALWSNEGRDLPKEIAALGSLLLSLGFTDGFQVARPIAGMPVVGHTLTRDALPSRPLDTPGPVPHGILHGRKRLDRPSPLMGVIDKSVSLVKNLIGDGERESLSFTDATVGVIAAEVQKSVFLPGVPTIIVHWLVRKIVETMANKLSFETQVELTTMIEKGPPTGKDNPGLVGKDLGYTKKNIQELAEKISTEIAPEITIPFVDKEKEEATIRDIVNLLLTRRLTSGAQKRLETLEFVVDGGKLLLDEEGREQLAKKLSEEVDVPFLSEEREQKILLEAVSMTANIIEDTVPASLLEFMDGLELEDADGFGDMKAKLVERLDNVHLPGAFKLVPKAAKTWVFKKVVDRLLEKAVGDTAGDMASLTVEDRLAKLEERLEACEQNLKINEARHQMDQENLKKRIANLGKRIEAERESSD